MKPGPPPPERPSWGVVYLVCKACGKRSDAPKRLKPKALAGLVRRASKGDKPRPRVLLTSCLGLCPKAATAVAIAGTGLATRVIAIRSVDEADAALSGLAEAARRIDLG